MAKRSKRLKKGIFSLERQVKLHEDKRGEAIEMGKKELADYYEREIEDLEEKKKEREEKLKRK